MTVSLRSPPDLIRTATTETLAADGRHANSGGEDVSATRDRKRPLTAAVPPRHVKCRGMEDQRVPASPDHAQASIGVNTRGPQSVCGREDGLRPTVNTTYTTYHATSV